MFFELGELMVIKWKPLARKSLHYYALFKNYVKKDCFII